MEILPNFLQQGIPTNYDNSIERTSIQECHPSATNFALGSQINFTYDGSELYRLSSNRTGFRCTFSYVTQSGNPLANDMNANVTLASNFFSNYFNKMSILLGNKEIESFSDPGIIADILSNIK